jgi:hypothetical protein
LCVWRAETRQGPNEWDSGLIPADVALATAWLC